MFRLIITLLITIIVIPALYGLASLKVTGGTDADIRDFPYLVLMATDNVGYYCSGTLISTTFALTSGYCAYVASFFTDPTYVVSNASSFNDAHVVKTYLLMIIIHPDYDLITKTNDIGVIGVDHPLNCVNCLPISLSSSGVSIGDSVTISGWGYVRETGSKLVKPNVLQTTKVIVVDPDECEGNYSLLIKDNTFVLIAVMRRNTGAVAVWMKALGRFSRESWWDYFPTGFVQDAAIQGCSRISPVSCLGFK